MQVFYKLSSMWLHLHCGKLQANCSNPSFLIAPNRGTLIIAAKSTESKLLKSFAYPFFSSQYSYPNQNNKLSLFESERVVKKKRKYFLFLERHVITTATDRFGPTFCCWGFAAVGALLHSAFIMFNARD